ncbi:MAG: hypothetical protein EHM67_18515, partial [Hyphomicrobiaceae bacterium]
VGQLMADQAGAVGMMFGLLVIPIAATVGLAVDFGRVYAVNNHTQAALDAAALAAGRVSQLEKVDTVNKASAAADAYFSTAKPSNVVQSSLQFSPNALNTEFKVTATSWVRTPFLGILHALERKDSEAAAPAVCQGNYFGCVKVVTTATAALCPSSACSVGAGGNNSKGESLEISLMLDVTGSMCDPCTKIDDLKAAAKDLVDIVIWDDQSAYTSKIALSPFAPAVNVGSISPSSPTKPIARTTTAATARTSTIPPAVLGTTAACDAAAGTARTPTTIRRPISPATPSAWWSAAVRSGTPMRPRRSEPGCRPGTTMPTA